ncbi:MAG: flavodoxin family protein [Cellulosilyticaceae bacterium]
MKHKVAIIYYSKTGKTKEMAEVIAEGARQIPDIEAKIFDIEAIDENFLKESRAVIFGTPTYYASTCWQIKKWFDDSHSCNLEGKIGAVFATANYAQGGADVAIMAIVNHLMVKGMLVYSGGSALGQPYIHLGAVALKENFEASKEQFTIFGQRIGEKVVTLWPLNKAE